MIMVKKITDWIRTNKVPAAFILGTLLVFLTFGIWYGVTYLQFRDHELDFRGDLIERDETIGVVYHHTDSEDVGIEQHHRFHKEGRGWLGIGYNYHITQEPVIETGRPHNKVGAHAGSRANRQTIGVAFSGNFNEEATDQEQLQAGAELHVWLEERAGYGELQIFKHSDWSNTQCPGHYFDINKLEQLIEEEREYRDKPDEDKKTNDIDLEFIPGTITGEELDGYLIDGRIYVPIREVGETLERHVEWDGENRTWRVE